jgi:hypothetical protein
MSSVYLCAFVITTAGLMAPACRESPTQPSSSAPATSTLTFQVAAGAGNAADGGSYSTTNAGFGASVRPLCPPNPNIPGSGCLDLRVQVRGTDGRLCELWATAPVGRPLGVGSYPKAAFGVAFDTAGFSFKGGREGTKCGDNTAAFTIHELESASSGVVTRLHMTFEQTCLSGFPPAVGEFGKGTGELWIVNGAASIQ